MVEMKEDVVLLLSDPTPFANFVAIEPDMTSRLARSFALGA